MYEIERTYLLQLLTQVGLSNSVVSLAEKYHDFPTLLTVCENSTEGRSEMLHDYMIHFASEVRNGMVCSNSFQSNNFLKGFAKFVFQKYKEQGLLDHVSNILVVTVGTGRIKELMSAPVECYQELEEFLAPYEELRWMHEINTRQYHSAYSTLSACAHNERQSLAKQKVLTW